MSEQTFLEALPLIERLVAHTCRRNGLFGADAEDFGSWLKLRIIERDYAVFSKFEGRSSLESYLAIVVQNLFRDYRTSRWGKWRPSAAARRLGPIAVELDTLISRDGTALQEAIQIVRSRLHSAPSVEELEAMAAQLPVRVRARPEGDEALLQAPAPDDTGERLEVGELAPEARRLQEALNHRVAELPVRDQLILRMHFQQGLRFVEIAQALDLDAKRLYPRVQRLLRNLRRALERDRVSWAAVSELLDWGFEPELRFPAGGRSLRRGSVSSSEEVVSR